MKKNIFVLIMIIAAMTAFADGTQKLQKAQEQYKNGNYSRAQRLYFAALKKGLSAQQEADAFYDLVQMYMECEMYEEAAETCEWGLETGYYKNVFYNELAIIGIDTGKMEKSEEYLHQAIEIDAGFDAAYFNMGYIKYFYKDFDEALEWFLDAHTLNPERSIYVAYIALSYSKLGDFEQADSYCLKAEELEYSEIDALKEDIDKEKRIDMVKNKSL